MQIVVRASIMFVFLWITMRCMGRKELAQLSPAELVLLVVLGDLIQQGVTQSDTSMTAAILAVSTFVLWMLGISYLSYKSNRAQNALEGQPVVLIENGRVMRKMLEYERLTEDELKDAALEQGIADLRQVSLGVLSADGKFAFVRFDERRPHAQQEVKT